MKRTEPQGAPQIEPASTEEALAFVREIFKRRGDRSPADELRVQKYVDSIPLGRLKGIAQRIMMDIARGPVSEKAPRGKRRTGKATTARPDGKKGGARTKAAPRTGRRGGRS
jgi:hypothetical protein